MVCLSILRRLQGILRRKHLKAIAEEVIMSHIRYGLGMFMTGTVRLSEQIPISQELNDLQVKMNDMLRIILNTKRSDKVSIQSMLAKCNMLSINQTVCKTILLEFWKSLQNNVTSIVSQFQKRENPRVGHLFKTSHDPRSFISVAAKLYERTSRKFQEMKMLSIAKVQAHKLVKALPI